MHEAPSKFATRLTPNNLCISCHANVNTDSITGHAPIANAPQHSNCIGCHMAPVGKSATVGDERVHTFLVVKPAVTLKLGGGDVAKQPNSCNRISHVKHMDRGLHCVDCHAGLAHGTLYGGPARPAMTFCVDCHAKHNPLMAGCTVCHLQLAMPAGGMPLPR